jgi:hypothetical protein
MNQYRSSRKLFRKKPPRELLPTKPIEILIAPWFVVQVGYLTEDDVALAKSNERKLIDYVIDHGGQPAGSLDYDCVHSLYRKGLVYLDVPVDGDDYVSTHSSCKNVLHFQCYTQFNFYRLLCHRWMDLL